MLPVSYFRALLTPFRNYLDLKEVVDAEREQPPPQLDDIGTTVATLYWSTLQLERWVNY